MRLVATSGHRIGYDPWVYNPLTQPLVFIIDNNDTYTAWLSDIEPTFIFVFIPHVIYCQTSQGYTFALHDGDDDILTTY